MSPSELRPASHRRMLAELEAIRQRTDEHNLFQGTRPLELARAELAAVSDSDPVARFEALLRVGNHEQRLGNEPAAIKAFTSAYELAPQLAGRIDSERALEAVYRLAIAYLRLGETRNCAANPSAQACILPLRERAIHTDQEGSRTAIRYLTEVLERTPGNRPLHHKSMWLLNLAYMTVAGYPHDVPAHYLIPPAVFESDQDFPRFENRAPELGLDTFNLFGGAVADDFTGDDWLDIVITTSDTSGQMRFFRNDRGGTFTEATEEAGLLGLYGGLNVIQADYDNDGDMDLYVLRGAWLSDQGRYPNSLLRNELTQTGETLFTDVTFDVGLGQVHYPTQTGAWADYDNDGFVDLYVGNEHNNSIDAPCQLFHNDGDGTFTEVAAAAGVDNRSFVKGVVFGDYDHDRWPDLYVSTLGGPNRLYHNLGDGTFRDVAPELGVTGPNQSFPVWFWDFDNDGNLDLYVPSYIGYTDAVGAVAASYLGVEIPVELPHLYRGDGRGGFADVAAERNLTRLDLPMGANYGDLDNDGWLDFYLGTGYPDYEGLIPNALYRNVEGRVFADVTWAAGMGHLQKGHAVTFADFDDDGDQDVFEQMGGAFPGDKFHNAYYENPGFGQHWLTLQLLGKRSNRAAIGARIRLEITEDGRRRTVYKHVSSGGSFGSNPLRQHLGVGRAGRIDRLEVYWPTSDLTQSFTDVAVDRSYRLEEGAERLIPFDPMPPS